MQTETATAGTRTQVDIEATKARFKETGRKFSTYARAKGFDSACWQQKMAGNVKFNEAEIAAMKEDGLLVETTH